MTPRAHYARFMALMGFFSYVHRDDDLDRGRIRQLANDIAAHYEAQTTEPIEVFLDRDDLHWGDRWRDKIDEALSNVAFFIPVVTPRYFASAECRREFTFFWERVQSLGIRELVLPVLYIKSPRLEDPADDDPVLNAVREVQWRDWTPFRFKELDSEGYRAAVDSLASELVRRVADVEQVDLAAAVNVDVDDDDGEEDGFIDKIARLEEAMPNWTESLTAIGEAITTIGALMRQGTEDIQRGEHGGKAFAVRLTVARRLASQLSEPVEAIESQGQKFVAELNAVDVGIRTLLESVADNGIDESNRETVCGFLQSIRDLSSSAHNGLSQTEVMVRSTAELEKQSKDMRTPLRRLRRALTSMVEARDITDAWVALVNEVDADCAPA